MPPRASLPVSVRSKGQDREEHDLRTAPTTEWIYALRTAIGTIRTFQRLDIWLKHVTTIG